MRDIVAAIDSVIASHLKVTGRPLGWREAARRAERFREPVFEGQPWACRVICLLLTSGYDDAAIWDALGYLDEHGHARGCDALESQEVLEIDSDAAFRPARVAVREDSGRIIAIRDGGIVSGRPVPDADLAELVEAQDFAHHTC